MGFTLTGLLTLPLAQNYASVLVAAAFVGAGSSIFHPESSRIARLASGGRHGLAQSIFQVGGSAGSAVGWAVGVCSAVARGLAAGGRGAGGVGGGGVVAVGATRCLGRAPAGGGRSD